MTPKPPVSREQKSPPAKKQGTPAKKVPTAEKAMPTATKMAPTPKEAATPAKPPSTAAKKTAAPRKAPPISAKKAATAAPVAAKKPQRPAAAAQTPVLFSPEVKNPGAKKSPAQAPVGSKPSTQPGGKITPPPPFTGVVGVAKTKPPVTAPAKTAPAKTAPAKTASAKTKSPAATPAVTARVTSFPQSPAKTPWVKQHRESLRKLIPAFVLVPVLAAAGVLLTLNGATIAPQTADVAGSAAVANDPAALAEASSAAQTWVRTNITRDQRLIVDDSMTAELTAAGWNPTNVIAYDEVGVYSVVSNAWRDADYVVTTPDAITADSPALTQAITNSVVVASFGGDPESVQVRRITPEGQLLASVDASKTNAKRVELGSELAENPALKMSVADRELLTNGRIDGRVIVVLGALAGRGDVAVSAFPRLSGEPGQVIRQVAVESMNGVGLVQDGQMTPDARAIVWTLSGDFAPDSAVVSGTSVVLRYPIAIDPLAE